MSEITGLGIAMAVGIAALAALTGVVDGQLTASSADVATAMTNANNALQGALPAGGI